MGLGTIVLDRGRQAVLPRRGDLRRLRHGVARARRRGARCTARGWRAQRKAGHFVRRVIIVGTDRRAMALAELFATHPEAGIRVVGLVGSAARPGPPGAPDLWLANYADADGVLAGADVDGVVLCSSDINPALLDVLIRGEQRPRPRPVPRPGLSGIDFRRVQALPIAHQPLLYVESPSLSRLQVGFKRAFDVAVAAALLVAAVAAAGAARRARQARGPRPGAVPPAPCRPRRRRVRDAQVPLDVRRRRGPAGRAAGRAATSAPARCSSSTAPTRGSRGSGGSCGRPASTSCRSCSTCCAAT